MIENLDSRNYTGKTSFCCTCTVWSAFRYLEPFRRDSRQPPDEQTFPIHSWLLNHDIRIPVLPTVLVIRFLALCNIAYCDDDHREKFKMRRTVACTRLPHVSLPTSAASDCDKTRSIAGQWWPLPNQFKWHNIIISLQLACSQIKSMLLTDAGSDERLCPYLSWTRNSSGDEIANVNFLYDDIVHAVKIQ